MYLASFSDILFRLQDHDVAFAILSRKYHTLRFNAHHRAVLKVKDEGTFLAHEVFGLVPLQKPSDCCPFLSVEVDYHPDKISRSCNVGCVDDFANAEVKFPELIERDIGAQGFTVCLLLEVCF